MVNGSLRWALESGRLRGTGFQNVRKEMAVGEMGGYLEGGLGAGGGKGPSGGKSEVGLVAVFFFGGMIG